MISDAKENNTICCHKQDMGNWASKCFSKECKCGYNDLIRTVPVCERISTKDIKRALTDTDYADLISQHQVWPAFNEVPLANHKEGTNGSCSFEPLHVNCLGNFKEELVEVLLDLIGVNNTNKTDKEKIDILFLHTASDVKSISERGFPIFMSDDQVYILPITSIKQSLIVVRNFGANNSVSYLHCLLSSKRPQLFTNLIRNLMTKHNENSDNDENKMKV